MSSIAFIAIEIVDEETDETEVSYLAKAPSDTEGLVESIRSLADMLESGELGRLPAPYLH